MQNAPGKLMEQIAARKFVQNQERRNVAPPPPPPPLHPASTKEGIEQGKNTLENAA